MTKTNQVFGKLMVALLCVAVLLSITPLSASASTNVIDLSLQETDGVGWSYDGAGNYTITGDVSVVGDSGYVAPWSFDISNNATVTWKATSGGVAANKNEPFVCVTGEGVFDVAEGKITHVGPGSTIEAGSAVTVVVSGGTVNNGAALVAGNGTVIKAEGKVKVSGGSICAYASNGSVAGSCTVIDAAEVEVTGGAITTSEVNSGLTRRGSTGVGILASGSVTISGGTIKTTNRITGTTIFAGGDVTITGGNIHTGNDKISLPGNAQNQFYGVAIRSDNATDIEISGDSTIKGRNGIVLAPLASVTVGGNAHVEVSDKLEYKDGQLLGNAIVAKNVAVEGNAQVEAFNGAAVLYSGTLSVSGGAVCALGDGIGGAVFTIDVSEGTAQSAMLNVVFKSETLDFEPDVEYADSAAGLPAVTGDGVVIAADYNAWVEKSPDSTSHTYAQGDMEDILVYAAGEVDYGWDGNTFPLGIVYSRGGNSGVFQVFYTTLQKKPMKPNPRPDPTSNPDDPDDPPDDPGDPDDPDDPSDDPPDNPPGASGPGDDPDNPGDGGTSGGDPGDNNGAGGDNGTDNNTSSGDGTWESITGASGATAAGVSTSSSTATPARGAVPRSNTPQDAAGDGGTGSGAVSGLTTGTGGAYLFPRDGEDMTFHIDMPPDSLQGISVDGVSLTFGAEYSIANGTDNGVLIVLSAQMLEALAQGEHTLTAVFEGQTVELAFTLSEEPESAPAAAGGGAPDTATAANPPQEPAVNTAAGGVNPAPIVAGAVGGTALAGGGTAWFIRRRRIRL